MENHYNPTEIIFGEKSLERLPEVAKRFKFKKVFLVTGRNSSDSSGLTNKVADYIGELQQYKVNPNPTTFDIEQGISIIEKGMPYLFIGLGGGSAIDTAKAISVLSKNKGLVANYQDKKLQIKNRGHPLIAIPTTAGTGSEVTPYSSLMKADKTKASIAHNFLYPNVAIIDPELTYNSPKEVIACSGMDALCQAIESFWSRNRKSFSESHALKAIKLIYHNIKESFSNENALEAKRAMSLGSCLAGIAISQTKTTAVHAVSYPITGIFNVPHGHACALTLSSFLNYNKCAAPERVSKMAEILGYDKVEDAAEGINNLMDYLCLERKLSKLGIDESGIELIIKNGFNPDRVSNNPRKLTEEDLRKMLTNLL